MDPHGRWPSGASLRHSRCVLATLLLIGASAAADEEQAAPPGTEICGYDPDHGAFLRTPDGRWELNPYAMVQVQSLTGIHQDSVVSTGFLLRSAKLIFHGHIFDHSLTYHFQLNGGEGVFAMEDVYLRFDPVPWFGLLAGQIEVPFNRQHITLEAYQQFVARSIVDQAFNLQRDLGLAAYLASPGNRLEATVGLWNGSRQDLPNDDAAYMSTLRLAWNPFGPIPFREADLDDSPTPKLSLAAAGAYNPHRRFTRSGQTSPVTLTDVAQGDLELALRYRGISLTSEAHARRQIEAGAGQEVSRGVFGQLGVFLIPHHLEVVARYARNWGYLRPEEPTTEARGGVSYYFHGHRLKLQLDGGLLTTGLARTWDLRAQLEFFM